jgi:hypothetical protein
MMGRCGAFPCEIGLRRPKQKGKQKEENKEPFLSAKADGTVPCFSFRESGQNVQ